MPNIQALAPSPGTLAEMIEGAETARALRRRVIHQESLVAWPSARSVGVASVKATALNGELLELAAKWWCPCFPGPQQMLIDNIRTGARERVTLSHVTICC